MNTSWLRTRIVPWRPITTKVAVISWASGRTVMTDVINLAITKIFRLFFSTNFKNNFMQVIDVTKDTAKPIISVIIKSISTVIFILAAPKTVAAKRVGIEIKKLNLAASTLEKPKYLAAVIVIPDLDVPGIRAIA